MDFFPGEPIMSLAKMLVILLLWLPIMVSCSLFYDPKIDQSFLTNQPCASPCWYGLIPGEATKADVLETLKELPFIDYSSIREYGTVWNLDNAAESIRFGCSHPKKEGCGAALISDDQLKVLWLNVNFRLDIEMVVNKLGPSSYVDYGVYAPEVGGCIVSFSWPKLNIEASNLDTRNNRLCSIIQNQHNIPRKIEIQSMSYAVDEAFSPEPGGCCQRIEWPGFEKP
jgi:hypothetical protein